MKMMLMRSNTHPHVATLMLSEKLEQMPGCRQDEISNVKSTRMEWEAEFLLTAQQCRSESF